MEITLMINGEEKTFKETRVNFITIRKCLEWKRYIDHTQEQLMKLLTTPIDDSTDEETINELEEAKGHIEQHQDIEKTLDLIMSFFKGHFTYDEFMNGCFFDNIGDFYQLGMDIYELAIAQKKETEGKNKKKHLPSKKKILKHS